jgi:hypothetical protein
MALLRNGKDLEEENQQENRKVVLVLENAIHHAEILRLI